MKMVRLMDDPDLRNRRMVFLDRTDAGRRLAGFMKEHLDIVDPLICAIPAGGVPVGVELAMAYRSRLFLGFVRKLKVPWNPEAGFGSVTLEGKVILNQELVRSLSITGQEIETAVAEAKESIRKGWISSGKMQSCRLFVEGPSLLQTTDSPQDTP